MGSGGGGQTGTNWADLEIARMKQEKEDWNRAHQEAKDRDAETIRQINYNDSLSSGYNGAYTRGLGMVEKRGLDPKQYEGVIKSTLDATRAGISQKDANPGQYFTDSVIENALARERDNLRSRYTNEVTKRFSPGFEQSYFTGNSDDRFIDDILGRQKQEATSYLDRAKSRGTLDESGFAAAMRRIGEMESTGRATANKLGDSVLQGNRTRLTDIANQAKSQAGSYELGQDFSSSLYDNRFNETLGNLNSNLEGDIRGVMEGQKFFDVADLIARGGSLQGAVNAPTESLDAIAAREKLRNTPRGIGMAPGGTF